MAKSAVERRRRKAGKKRLKSFKQQLKRVSDGHKDGTALLNSGEVVAFLSYVQLPKPRGRKAEELPNGKKWPEGLAKELNDSLDHTNVTKFWFDQMGYPDIKTLGPASGLKPYASEQGMVIVRGAFGKRYHGYHFIAYCGSYVEMALQAALEKNEVNEALRWKASSRLWPSAEVAIGIMHGRIAPTKKTKRAADVLIRALQNAIDFLDDENVPIETRMGFSFLKRSVRCKACGAKNKAPKVDWCTAASAMCVYLARIREWRDKLLNSQGGTTVEFLNEFIVGPMWSAECFDGSDRLPVATLTAYLWMYMGKGGTELARKLEALVGRPDPIMDRILASFGGDRPTFWYESLQKETDRVFAQAKLSVRSRFGTTASEQDWFNAIWHYPSKGRCFMGNLTFSAGKDLMLDAIQRLGNGKWAKKIDMTLQSQQRNLWPLVGNTLPWYYKSHEGIDIVLLPVIPAREFVTGQIIGGHVGKYQYCLEAELTADGTHGNLVLQLPMGPAKESYPINRHESGLLYLAISMQENSLCLKAIRPCHNSHNREWANIHPADVTNPINGDGPEQGKMYGANGYSRDFSDLYCCWQGTEGFALLGTLDEKNIVDYTLVNAHNNLKAQSVGWTWQPSANQEAAVEALHPVARRVLGLWTTPWCSDHQ